MRRAVTGKKVTALESKLERSFRKDVLDRGCLYLKLDVTGQAGYTDRMIIGKRKMIFFVELKRAGETARELQVHRHDRLRRHGFSVYVVDNYSDALVVLDAEIAKNDLKP